MHSGTRILLRVIEDVLFFEVAGGIGSAQRMTKAGTTVSADSARSHQLGDSSMKSMAISGWNPRLTIGW